MTLDEIKQERQRNVLAETVTLSKVEWDEILDQLEAGILLQQQMMEE